MPLLPGGGDISSAILATDKGKRNMVNKKYKLWWKKKHD